MIENSGLQEELAKIKRLGKTFDDEIKKGLKDLGQDWRDDVKKTISVGESNKYTVVDKKTGRKKTVSYTGGQLRKSTKFDGVYQEGGKLVFSVSNNQDYVEHYEYGHRQEPGRFVPALGKRLKASYVKGRYTFRKARVRTLNKVPVTLRKAIERAEAKFND